MQVEMTGNDVGETLLSNLNFRVSEFVIGLKRNAGNNLISGYLI